MTSAEIAALVLSLDTPSLALLAEAARQEMVRRAGPGHRTKARPADVGRILARSTARGGVLKIKERDAERLQRAMREREEERP